MRYFVVTTYYDNNRREIIYPPNYQYEIGDRAVDHLYYNESGALKLLLLIKDADAGNIVRSNVVEVTEVQAKVISEANEQRLELITDEGKVRRLEILTRGTGGYILTVDDLKALDPDDPVLGINRQKILADRIDVLKVKG